MNRAAKRAVTRAMHRRRGSRSARLGALLLVALVLACGPAAALDPSVSARGTAKQPSSPPPWSGIEPSVEPSTPGAQVLAVADRLIAAGTIVRGSCYGYVSHVFETAGYPSDRRAQVFRSAIAGPYADLSTIAPGDWLALVNHPERDPMGTHSVIFVRWEDRAAGQALVVSYAGGESERPGEYTTYDVTRTYRISRASDAAP